MPAFSKISGALILVQEPKLLLYFTNIVMSAAQLLNPKAESRASHLRITLSICLLICIQRRGEALKVNISAGEGLQDVLKSNLGPTGTIKMFVYLYNFSRDKLKVLRLVDGAGAVCVYRDGTSRISGLRVRRSN